MSVLAREDRLPRPALTAWPADAPTILVAAVGAAEGAQAAAAALACAGADGDRAALLVELGARPPRPTLLASASAQRLEERLAAHLPQARAAARGQICQLAVGADEEGIEAAAAAVTVARGQLSVLRVPPALFQSLLAGDRGPRVSGVLLRADLTADRSLLALAVRDVLDRDLRVAVLKRPLGWVVARRALFGALPAGAAGALPPALLRRLGLSHACYGESDGTEADSAGAAQPERRDHAGPRPRRGVHRHPQR